MSVTVVGAGISGLSIAVHLLQRNIGPVTIVDRQGVAAGASGVQPGGVRQQWSTRASCLMAKESHAAYVDLDNLLGTHVNARFERCGYLFAADTDETLGMLEANVAVQHSAGVPSQVISAAEMSALAPGLRTHGIHGAAYCAEDGYFDRPMAVVEAFASAARALGAAFEFGRVATGIVRDGTGWQLTTAEGSLSADVLVVAAANGSVPLFDLLGFDLPLTSEPRYLFLSEPCGSQVLAPLVVAIDRGIALKQLADGRLLASDLRATGDPTREEDRWRARISENLVKLLPDTPTSFPTMVRGTYDMTPDAQPIIDELDEGLWLAAGFSGHGFMVAPSTGRFIAGSIAGDEPPEWSESVRWERFAGSDREQESQVI
jgi:sarcosine oxidase subunit beta